MSYKNKYSTFLKKNKFRELIIKIYGRNTKEIYMKQLKTKIEFKKNNLMMIIITLKIKKKIKKIKL